VSEAEIVSLIKSGTISPATLVCEQGKTHWQPVREVSCFQMEVFPGSPAENVPPPPVQDFSSPQPAPGNVPYQAESFPAVAGGGASGKYIALGIGGLALVVLLLWGTYSLFFGSLSPEGLGKEVFGALVDDDADAYINDCTPWGFSTKKYRKMMMKLTEAKLDHEVENGKITAGERDRQLIKIEKEFEEEDAEDDQEKEMKEAVKELRENFKEVIDEGKSAGLNWSKAEFEFIDDSDFETSESEGENAKDIPDGYGGGDLVIVISDGGKRYKIGMRRCIIIPGYGCLNMRSLRWLGEN
jgi:hypothetical protein